MYLTLVPEQWVRVECDGCTGTGETVTEHDKSCRHPISWDTGVCECPDCDHFPVDCPMCDGTGSIDADRAEVPSWV